MLKNYRKPRNQWLTSHHQTRSIHPSVNVAAGAMELLGFGGRTRCLWEGLEIARTTSISLPFPPLSRIKGSSYFITGIKDSKS